MALCIQSHSANIFSVGSTIALLYRDDENEEKEIYSHRLSLHMLLLLLFKTVFVQRVYNEFTWIKDSLAILIPVLLPRNSPSICQNLNMLSKATLWSTEADKRGIYKAE